MYEQFFGLRRAPFSIAPDPRYLFMSQRHREALAHLLYGVGGGGGFVLLSGEIGTGKTTISRCFLEQVPAHCQVAYIFNPRLTVHELLLTVCEEFGVSVPAPADGGAPSAKACIAALNAHLLAAHAQGRQCVLIIDEAQNLAADVLEQLRLLTNLETTERKLLQIMLIGQPELRRMVADPGLEQLAQRVIARYHLGALTEAETAAYLAHRLVVAGRQGAMPFDRHALRRIHQLTGGVPRRINLLADRAMLGAFAESQGLVSRRIVDQAAREVFDSGGRPRWQPGLGWRRAGALLGGAALMLGLGWAAWLAWPPAGLGSRAGTVAEGGRGLSSLPGLPLRPASGSGMPGLSAASGPAAAVIAPSGAAVPSTAKPSSAAQGLAGAASEAGGSITPPGNPAEASATVAAWPRDELAGWRELAALWGAPAALPDTGDPCGALRLQALRCFRSNGITLSQLRQMDRPGLLALHLGDGAPRWARLQALGDDKVRLVHAGQTVVMPLADFIGLWRGDYATLWRPPAGYGEALQPGARGPAVDALAQALASSQQRPAPAPGQALTGALAARLAAFQVAHSLRPDGLAGPTTFMQLNRATGVAEPRLAAAPVER